MKILIGYDGSACADTAIRDLRRAGLPGDVQAIVLAAADLVDETAFVGYESPDSPMKWIPPSIVYQARASLADAMANTIDVASRGSRLVAAEFPIWKVSHEAVSGSARESLIAKAEKWKAKNSADLIVLGTRSADDARLIPVGRTTERLLHEAPCSVLIVKPKQYF